MYLRSVKGIMHTLMRIFNSWQRAKKVNRLLSGRRKLTSPRSQFSPCSCSSIAVMHSWSIQKCRFAILLFLISVGNFMLMINIRNRNSESLRTDDLGEHEISRSGRESPPRAVRAYLHNDALHVESLELNYLEGKLRFRRLRN